MQKHAIGAIMIVFVFAVAGVGANCRKSLSPVPLSLATVASSSLSDLASLPVLEMEI